jgi:predicted nucleotidyltransferase
MTDNRTQASPAFDIKAAAENLRKRFERNRRERLALHERAARDAAAIIEMVRKRYNPKRIYQWGSVLKPEQFDENSDIDIAVEGLRSAEEFFALFGDAWKMTKFPLDLVEIEKVHPAHIDSIRERGKLVYERTDPPASGFSGAKG